MRGHGDGGGVSVAELVREGEYWTIVFADRELRVRDSKGMGYLAELLAHPDKEYPVLALAGGVDADRLSRTEAADARLVRVVDSDAGPLLDEQAKRGYRERLEELREEIDQADAFHDPERAARARVEYDAIVGELTRATGLRGRDRRAGSPIERARLNVTRAIKTAITRISDHDAVLAQQLSGCVRTGRVCVYRPDPESRTTWSVSTSKPRRRASGAFARPQTRYAKAGEVSIAYQVVGDGPVDLVLFPGWFSHMDLQWEIPLIARFLHRLASFSRLILFDKRGVGLSDPVSSAPTLDERMDDLHAVMDAVGCEQASIFGLSEGGTMSAMFAAAHPERVNALVLYGSWFAGPAVLAEHKQPGWQKAQAVARSLDDAVEHWGEGRMAKFMAPSVAAFPGTLEYVGAFERAALSRRMAADLWEAITHHDARSALPLIRAPTLVLHRRDEVVPIEQARYLADHIPEAQLVELQGVDHFPWIGDTESVASSVEEFVSTGRPSRKSKRVLATVLVSQIVDPDKDRPDDDLQRQSLADYQELTRRELDRYEGQRMKHPRDDVLATFSGPTRAVNCACAIRDQALRLGLEIRAALHTGECELNDETVHGAAVQIADRVINLAQPGEILTSRTVRDLLFGAEIEFDHRGEHALNELATWDIYAVGRPSQSAGTAPASDHK